MYIYIKTLYAISKKCQCTLSDDNSNLLMSVQPITGEGDPSYVDPGNGQFKAEKHEQDTVDFSQSTGGLTGIMQPGSNGR